MPTFHDSSQHVHKVEMRADSLVVERQLDCQPSIRTKRKIRKVLKPQTSDGRRVAEGRNAPSVGRITRFAGAFRRQTARISFYNSF